MLSSKEVSHLPQQNFGNSSMPRVSWENIVQPLCKEPPMDGNFATMLLGNGLQLVHHKVIQLHIDLKTTTAPTSRYPQTQILRLQGALRLFNLFDSCSFFVLFKFQDKKNLQGRILYKPCKDLASSSRVVKAVMFPTNERS